MYGWVAISTYTWYTCSWVAFPYPSVKLSCTCVCIPHFLYCCCLYGQSEHEGRVWAVSCLCSHSILHLLHFCCSVLPGCIPGHLRCKCTLSCYLCWNLQVRMILLIAVSVGPSTVGQEMVMIIIFSLKVDSCPECNVVIIIDQCLSWDYYVFGLPEQLFSRWE